MKKVIFILSAVFLLSGFGAPCLCANTALAYSPGQPGELTEALRLQKSSSEWINQLYNVSKTLLNAILLIGLIIAAIAMTLSLPIESYTIKKMMPRVIFAVLIGNTIISIAAIGSSIIDNIMQISIFKWTWTDTLSIMGMNLADTLKAFAYSLPAITNAVSGGILVIGLLLSLLPALFIIIVNLFLSLRVWIVLIAVALGPIAVGLSLLPFTEGLYKKWYKILIFWLVFPLIVNFFLFIIKLIPDINP
ncbi:MAG: hypothetical protein BWY43_00520 [candidate division WS2 bacterium ADurb.Bin280]|uniref:TrbL/VirB6 plasmid conjugal transfer protein n=1 Tax=candidate division WS2 bacterium ADurb.Bin280 TaxID=1852829 RepID=A0A1V5SDY0_9BACT|nr:MAG: hypothetical protein BWY43_00520 [candidate division WS2 bacterium ADurb.Bin280]